MQDLQGESRRGYTTKRSQDKRSWYLRARGKSEEQNVEARPRQTDYIPRQAGLIHP